MNDPYRIEVTRSAVKDLSKFKQWRETIDGALMAIAIAPESGDSLAGALSGCRVKRIRLKGSGEGRIAYIVYDAARVCVVFAIGHRENFYDLASRQYESLAE